MIFQHDGHKRLRLHYKAIETLYAEIDASLGLYKKFPLIDYDISFQQGTLGCVPKPKIPDTAYRKTFICFIPPMELKVDEINGLAAGFLAYPSNYRDSLKINGLCVELLPVGLMAVFFGSFLMSDSKALSVLDDLEGGFVNIQGVNLSVGGSIAEMEMTGFYLGGFATIVRKSMDFQYQEYIQ